VFDPEAVKHVADELCHRAGVDVLLHSHLVAATRSQDQIASVRVADHSGIHDYTADAFVDATGEADLARAVDGDRGAGASLRVMGTAFATGQAAGVAAAVVARDADVDVAAMRRELDRQGARLPRDPGAAG
jgi:hypothetical protein